jgi:hypothetical protein
MDRKSADNAMRDCEVQGHVVEVQGRLIKVALLNEPQETLEVHDLGWSEFADLVLDWCGRLLHRKPKVSNKKLAA